MDDIGKQSISLSLDNAKRTLAIVFDGLFASLNSKWKQVSTFKLSSTQPNSLLVQNKFTDSITIHTKSLNLTNEDICQKSPEFKSARKKHKLFIKSDKTHKCCKCEKVFKFRSNLIVHSRVHTVEKPYKCELCDKCFHFKSSVKINLRTHTGERPFKCDICDKDF